MMMSDDQAWYSVLRDDGWEFSADGKHLRPKCAKNAYDASARKHLGIDK
jgi:hypothetical protein